MKNEEYILNFTGIGEIMTILKTENSFLYSICINRTVIAQRFPKLFASIWERIFVSDMVQYSGNNGHFSDPEDKALIMIDNFSVKILKKIILNAGHSLVF